jgi:alpha-D-xyloside xylohydrolase
MKQANDFAYDMLDLDTDKGKAVYCAGRDIIISEENGVIALDIPFDKYSHDGIFKKEPVPPEVKRFFFSSRGTSCLRFSGPFETGKNFNDIAENDNESPMLCFSAGFERQRLSIKETEKGIFHAVDQDGKKRMTLSRIPHSICHWNDLQGPSDPMMQIIFYPDGVTPVILAAYDQFFPGKFESMPLAYTEKENLFSVLAEGNEHFYGTGERFGRLDLAGRTITLENTDALGTDSRKAYKNIPFYLSSRGYGLFIHSSAHMRFSFADISNRAVQCSVTDDKLDIFFIAGNAAGTEMPQYSIHSSLERVLFLYRGITGFSPCLPLWSYGAWMSRMTYVSADEIRGITERLRNENYPCDVIHIDSGYFETEWVCDWDFSHERFPNPKAFIDEMRKKGFRICLWQMPNIGKMNKYYEEGIEKNYLPQKKDNFERTEPLSDFSGQEQDIAIDFSNPEAVSWYKSHLRRLMDYGTSVIKTDFGERINMSADYRIKSSLLHNLYGLLYQRAAWEVSAEYSDIPIGWSRAGWAGCQRYPLHWGGDTSATWDGLAQTLRGGLSLGLSGFTYWSHDIPGFHGLPDFMNSKPSEMLYLRWTQFGVFTSHMRYHGSYPREPWEYSGVAALVRNMLRLRYALIPYIMQEGEHCGKSGRAIIAPLLLDYSDDPAVWALDTQYLFGREMLVAPIMNDEGIRDIYLPEGEWLDFFTGKTSVGPVWIKNVKYALDQYPVFVKRNAVIPLYPEIVSCTDEIDLSKAVKCTADASFRGIYHALKKVFKEE